MLEVAFNGVFRSRRSIKYTIRVEKALQYQEVVEQALRLPSPQFYNKKIASVSTRTMKTSEMKFYAYLAVKRIRLKTLKTFFVVTVLCCSLWLPDVCCLVRVNVGVFMFATRYHVVIILLGNPLSCNLQFQAIPKRWTIFYYCRYFSFLWWCLYADSSLSRLDFYVLERLSVIALHVPIFIINWTARTGGSLECWISFFKANISITQFEQ